MMLYYVCLFLLAASGGLAKPVDPTSHILIVTPQAQVHLEPSLRYVHGLSPLARVAAPAHHEETIVYVPAGAAASVLPLEGGGAVVSSGRQFDQIIGQVGQQIAMGAETGSAQLSEGAMSAAAAASQAGAGLFPGLFPTPNVQKLKTEKIELIETPANTQALLPATEARQFYSLAPVYQTPVVDLVHAPVYLTSVSAIRARSLQDPELAAAAAKPVKEEQSAEPQQQQKLLIEEQKPAEEQRLLPAQLQQQKQEIQNEKKEAEELPLKIALKEQPQPQLEEKEQKLEPQPLIANANAEAEKKSDGARFLEANSVKEQAEKLENESNNKTELKADEKEIAPLKKIADTDKQQSKFLSSAGVEDAEKKWQSGGEPLAKQ